MFNRTPPKTKEEMIARIKTIPEHRNTLDPFVTTLYDAFGFTVFMRSVIPCSGGEEVIKRVMEQIKPKRAVVFGTNRGVSTARVAQFCEEVHTFDVVDSDMTERIWGLLGLKNIVKHVIRDNAEKARIVAGLEFDFAFLDGDHERDYQTDFELTKRCGAVLVHEYWPSSPVMAFMDSLTMGSLRVEGGNFAVWTASKVEDAPVSSEEAQGEPKPFVSPYDDPNAPKTPQKRGRRKTRAETDVGA